MTSHSYQDEGEAAHFECALKGVMGNMPSRVTAKTMKRLRFQDGVAATDAAILQALAKDARVTMADLARAVRLSPPSVTERVRRLEEAGVIQGYSAVIDPLAL